MTNEKTNEKGGIWTRLFNADRRIFFFLCFIVFATPLLVPLSIPLLISPWTENVINAVEGVSSGTVILSFNHNWGMLQWNTFGYAREAIYQEILKRDIAIVEWNTALDGPPVVAKLWTDLMGASPGPSGETPEGYKYGVNWVILPYTAGLEMAYSAFAKDIRSVVTVDYYGTPIDDIPLMQRVHNGGDFSMLLETTTNLSPGIEAPIRHFQTPYGMPYVLASSGVSYGPIATYVATGQIAGCLMDIRGVAEAEQYWHSVGMPSKTINVISLVNVSLVILLVVGNIVQYMARREGKVIK